jgi:hypothetical protein
MQLIGLPFEQNFAVDSISFFTCKYTCTCDRASSSSATELSPTCIIIL